MLAELKRCNSIGNIDGVLFLVSIMAGKDKISRNEIRNRCALENNITVNCPGAVAFFEYLRLVESTSDTVLPSDTLNSLAGKSRDDIIAQLVAASINRLVEDGIFDKNATGFDPEKGHLTIKRSAFPLAYAAIRNFLTIAGALDKEENGEICVAGNYETDWTEQLRNVCLSEELDIYGMTIFTDGVVEVYDPNEGLYDTQQFKAKTVLIDPEAVKKTNTGCRNNTIAHECVHWYKHRCYYKMQKYSLPRYAKYCRCRVDQLPESTDEEGIMEAQAIGIAPRILMPECTFIEAAEHLGISYGRDNRDAIATLADFYNVSKQSVTIRLEECSLL